MILHGPPVTLQTRLMFFWMNDFRVSVPMPLKKGPTCGSMKSFSAKSFTTAEIAAIAAQPFVERLLLARGWATQQNAKRDSTKDDGDD